MDPRIIPVLSDQAGVVSRRQLVDAGLTRSDLAGLLLCWPAALAGQSAMRVVEGPGSRRRAAPIEVAVERNRSLTVPRGIVLQRTAHLDDRVQWQLAPPRVRYEEAAVDVAARATTEAGQAPLVGCGLGCSL